MGLRLVATEQLHLLPLLAPSTPPSSASCSAPSTPSVTTIKGASVTTSKAGAHRLLVAANGNRRPWRAIDQEPVILDAMEAAGASSFRLTFSPTKEKQLRLAAASGRDIRQMIADAIAFQLRKLLGFVPPVGFAIEEAPATYRLHIHGCYLIRQDVPADQIREAFVRAGGDIPGQAGSTQFWHRPGYTLQRYFSYSRKSEASVMRRLGLDGVTFMNAPMKRLGRDTYEATRKPVHAAQTAPAPVSADTMTDDDLLVVLEDLPEAEAQPAVDDEVLALLNDDRQLTAAQQEILDELLADFDVDGDDQGAPATLAVAVTHTGTANARQDVPAHNAPASTSVRLRPRMSPHGLIVPRGTSPPN